MTENAPPGGAQGDPGAGAREDDFQHAVALHTAGRIADAHRLYQRILAVEPRHPGALNLGGVAAYQLGNRDQGIHLLEAAVETTPEDPAAHYNLGNMLRAEERLDDAETAYRRALHIQPDYADALNNLGNLLAALGRAAEAATALERAIEIDPERASAHHTLGTARAALGRLDEARMAYERALEITPGNAIIHYDLGAVLHNLGRLDDARAAYGRALEITPDHGDSTGNLGILLFSQGDAGGAVVALRRAVRLAPNVPKYWRALVSCLAALPAMLASEAIRDDVLDCLARDGLDPLPLRGVVMHLCRRQPDLDRLLIAARAGRLEISAGEIDETVRLLADPVLLAFMEKDRVVDPAMELLLTTVRRALLEHGIGGKLAFLSALAHQCFLNEYLYFETEDETARVERLEAGIGAAVANNDPVDAQAAALLACYRPLHGLAFAQRLADALSENPLLAAVVTRQVAEPARERALRDTIPVLTAIDDPTSRAVRQQYEETPYPRWQQTDVRTPRPLATVMSVLCPALLEQPVVWPDAPSVLIAGCGTGKHPITAAQQIKDTNVLAMDLSLTGLAYGKRKAREMGITNIEFVQGDILALAESERRFDIIECVGVLHHLPDPVAGWRLLSGLLEDGGLMLVGLYSELARAAVVAAQKFVVRGNYAPTPDGIRQCRRDIMMLAAGDPVRRIVERTDFFAMSPCRDLIFHAEEHHYTLPRIGEIIAELDLEFLTFEHAAPQTLRMYRTRFPEDAAATDLDSWHRFERDNPDTFLGMYQFWMRKPG